MTWQSQPADGPSNSGHYGGVDLAKLHTNRGVELKRKGDTDGAITDYDIAIELNPNDLFAFNNRANAWRDKGDLDRALADYGAAIALDRDYAAAFINRGLVHERKKAFDLARADYRAALATPPNKFNNSRGAHQMAQHRLAALAEARAGIAAQPPCSVTQFLGRALPPCPAHDVIAQLARIGEVRHLSSRRGRIPPCSARRSP